MSLHPTDPRPKAINAALCAMYGFDVAVTSLNDDAFKNDIADATLKFLAPTPSGGPGFMLMSGHGNPRLMARAVENIDFARSVVSNDTGAAILPPDISGDVDGRSFAIWPLKDTYHSSNRVVRKVRAQLYADQIMRWATALCQETLTKAAPEDVLDDLKVIYDDLSFPDRIRQAATEAANRINTQNWAPMTCIAHGDFWDANLLLSGKLRASTFYVIDWAGMQKTGYPVQDITRMMMSLRRGSRFNTKWIGRYCAKTGVAQKDIAAYALCASGKIGSELEHFPPDRYRAATVQLYDFVSRF